MKSAVIKNLSLLILAVFVVSGCSTTTNATTWNGLSSPDGQPLGHVSTSNVALHFIGSKPLVGDASLEKTVDDFTAAVKATGASKVRIVQSSCLKLWFIFPPVSIFVTPVFSNVAGDAVK